MSEYDLTYINTPHRQHRRLLTETSPGHYELCLDNTTLEKLLTCPRSFELYAVIGRDSGERDALNYGSAIHEALEVYYKGGSLDEMIHRLHDCFTAKPCSPDSWRNFDHALESIKQYHAWREGMTMCPWVPITLDYSRTIEEQHMCGKPAVEVPFKIELFKLEKPFSTMMYPPNLVTNKARTDEGFFDDTTNEQLGFTFHSITVYWTGKIDLIIERDGAPWPLDHKTTSIEGETFWAAFQMSAQMLGYCWATQKLLGREVPGVLIDAIYGRPPSKTGTKHANFFREFLYSQERIAGWERDTINHINRIFANLFEGYFPRATAWCVGKYGKCPYFNVCELSAKQAPLILMSGMYAERTWNPLTA